MNVVLKSLYTSMFYNWILSQNSEKYPITVDETRNHTLLIKTKTSKGEIVFSEHNIIELRIINRINGEVVFYLHFQMKTVSHAIELFKEMLASIDELAEKPVLHVLLCCSSGMTTTYFAIKMNEVARHSRYYMHFEAVTYQDLLTKGQDSDVILLAPQISYQYEKTKKMFPHKTVLNITPKIFAHYDAESLLDLVVTNQKKRRIKHITRTKQVLENHEGTLLAICFFRNSSRIHISYCVYDAEKIVKENEIIKPSISVQDIYDIVNTVLTQYSTLETIGISLPGIINDGTLASISIEGLEVCDLQALLAKRYKQKIVLANDANSAALGYHALQNQYQNLVYLFQPIAHYSGMGMIVNNELIRGRKNLTGETQFLPLGLSDEFKELAMTPEGALEIATKTILSVIGVLAPEAIVFYCQMIVEAEELIMELSKHIAKEYIPDIIKVETMQNYVLHGLMILCLT